MSRLSPEHPSLQHHAPFVFISTFRPSPAFSDKLPDEPFPSSSLVVPGEGEADAIGVDVIRESSEYESKRSAFDISVHDILVEKPQRQKDTDQFVLL